MSGVTHFLLLVRFDLCWELNRLRVNLAIASGLLCNLPVHPAVQMFDDPDLNRLPLVIAQGDLERFINPRRRRTARSGSRNRKRQPGTWINNPANPSADINSEIRSFALTHQI